MNEKQNCRKLEKHGGDYGWTILPNADLDLFMSLLDAKLISMQRNVDRNLKGKRSSGLGAIRKIEGRILQEQDVNKKFLLLLSYTNLFACLKVVFADGDDFKKQPKMVNRNFIEHGMLTSKVKKRDCIQLFLLDYNFLDFFDTTS